MVVRKRLLFLVGLLCALIALLVIWYLPSRRELLPIGYSQLDATSHTATPPLCAAANCTLIVSAAPTNNAADSRAPVALQSGRSHMPPPRSRGAKWPPAESPSSTPLSARATQSSTSVAKPADAGADPRAEGCAHFKHMGGRAFAEAVSSGAIRLSDGRKGGAEAVQVVHVSWKTAELPSRFARWSRTWCECFPNWTHVLWTDADNDWFVREHYERFYRKYSGFRAKISQVDSVRYLYLHFFGGVYTDLDTVCYKPFEQLLAGRAVVFGDMDASWGFHPHFHYIQNSFMYSCAGHQFWMDFINRIESESQEDVPGQGPVTGPYTLMNLLRERWNSYPGDFVVYPPNAFNPFSWINRRGSPCRDFNAMSDEQLASCIAHHRSPDTYTLEFHTETWRRGSIS